MQAAFAEMMAHPGRPDAAVRYARLAAERGDTRAAISALERVLRMDPSLDNIRLELASLHLASGSPDLAAVYAREALASPRIPPDVAERAQVLLDRADRGAARSVLDVNLFAGGRYDSNANEATSLGTVPVFVPALQNIVNVPNAVPDQASYSTVLGARLAHRYDLNLQREGTWETNAALFGQFFTAIPAAYDLTIATIDTGPRIGVAEFGSTQLALRPFTTAGWVGYGSDTYAWLYGGGLTAELRLPPRWTAELTWLGRFGNYQNSSFRPVASEFTGLEQNIAVTLGYAVSETTRLAAIVGYTTANAREPWWARDGWGVGVSVTTAVPVSTTYEIGLNARGGVRSVRYGAPDPFINPTVSRHDTRWEAGASLLFPLTGSLSVALDYDWYDQRSNYSFYRYGDQAVTLGLRFTL
jgi:hypothetical protein